MSSYWIKINGTFELLKWNIRCLLQLTGNAQTWDLLRRWGFHPVLSRTDFSLSWHNPPFIFYPCSVFHLKEMWRAKMPMKGPQNPPHACQCSPAERGTAQSFVVQHTKKTSTRGDGGLRQFLKRNHCLVTRITDSNISPDLVTYRFPDFQN